MKYQKFIGDGLEFKCQGSGKCCVSRGEYGYVYMTLEDRRKMARELGLETAAFTKKYCAQTAGSWHLKNNPAGPECFFLNTNNQCDVYKARPIQCRTWPFWPENMNAKTWSGEVANFCPGVGKGKKRKAEEIYKQLDEQIQSEVEIFGEG